MITPSGFAIEYGYDGWQVDWDDFTPTISHAPDLWGHEFQT
jgi:3,4-dihydroxy-9,10-secoandrosta-1,3,5(10)-triene-9,17-dione 4,5-dioxygenase